ncbi:hypothetical protein [Massilia sp. S19_KUP03_FR1]|uniref:hypothetical protein n=1 Tax=Massilia sp. S19_KUP03_FR1 TaxID=3025503 RepID=UPI002FCD8FB6
MSRYPTATMRAAGCLLLVLATGCASTGNGALTTLSAERAAHSIVIGKSDKADIRTAFGEASITPYPGGQEVWLYQLGYPRAVDSLPYVNLVISSADNRKELTILFGRDGLVKKYQLMDRARE